MKSFFQKEKSSFGFAFKGLFAACKSETHMKIHLSVLCCATLAGFYFEISTTEWLFLLLFFALVIALEILNTSLEKLVDLVSPDPHPIAGKVKDMAAGAVLWASIIAAISGLIIFVPKVLHYFS